MKEECSLCIFNSKALFIEETSAWFIDKSRDFEFKGLYFIRCKRQIESLAEMNEEESSQVGALIKKYSTKNQNETKAQKVQT